MGYIVNFMFKVFLKMSIKVFEKECNNHETCRGCKFGTLWNGCKVMELPPVKWRSEFYKNILKKGKIK